MCYHNHVLAYYKIKFCPNSSLKTDVSTQTDFSDELDRINKQDISTKYDSSNKQVRSREQNSTRKQARCSKQDSSNKEDSSKSCIIDADPILLCNKLREIVEKHDKSESDIMMIKMIIDEILRVKAITKDCVMVSEKILVFNKIH